MKKIGIIFNQSAGSFEKLARNPKDWIEEISGKHSITDIEFDVRVIPAPQINETIRHFVDNNYDVITAAGGDGTINGVATIIKDSNAALGVIPSGTFNHFAKDAGIPLDFEEAVLNLVNGQVALIDYGSVNDRIFLNNSSIGHYPVAVLTREAGRKRTNLNKKFAMVLASIKTSMRHPPIEISVDSDTEAENIRTPLVFIGNNYYDLSPLNIGKRSRLDSGKLYAYGSKCTSIWCSLHLAVLAFFNKLKLASEFQLIDFTDAVINSKRKKLPVAVDGEIYRLNTPLHYSMNHKSLKVMLPPKP